MGGWCFWSIDDVGGESAWETSCKRDFYFDGADGPVDAGFAWCPFCGKTLREQRTSESSPASDAVDPSVTDSGKPSTRDA